MTGYLIMIAAFIVVSIVLAVFLGKVYQSSGVGALTFVIVGAFFGWLTISYGMTSFAEDKILTCTVTSKDRGGGDDGSYRVYTEECGVLANGDNPFWNKYNSADVWAKIPDEGPVTVHIVGVRNGFFSWFPNIIEVLDSEVTT